MNNEILSVENLKIHFPLKRTIQDRIKKIPLRTVMAVDGVSFAIKQGETFGIVGESGSGKTTVSKGLVRLNPITDGRIYYRREDITTPKRDRKKALCKEIQYIFQDPFPR